MPILGHLRGRCKRGEQEFADRLREFIERRAVPGLWQIGEPFAATRHEENMALRRLCWDIDTRIEPFSLHADDFEKPYFALPREVEREGVEV